MDYETWRQAWLTMWGMVGLACLQSLPKKRKSRKKKQELPPKVPASAFLDAITSQCPKSKVFGTLQPMQWAVLTAKLKKQQYDIGDANALAAYLKTQTDWLRSPLHISSVVMKLEVWVERARIWRRNEPTPYKEKGGVAKLRR